MKRAAHFAIWARSAEGFPIVRVVVPRSAARSVAVFQDTMGSALLAVEVLSIATRHETDWFAKPG